MFLCFILQDIKKLLQCRTQIKGCTTPTKHEIFQACHAQASQSPQSSPARWTPAVIMGSQAGRSRRVPAVYQPGARPYLHVQEGQSCS